MNHRTEATASILLNLKMQRQMSLQSLSDDPWKGKEITEVVTAYLTGPAKKIAVRQVNRPTETTASWLSLPNFHNSLAFS